MRELSKGPKGWVGVNLRTGFLRLLRRAGIAPWPRLFHTLRASCETDLLAGFPITAVTEGLGHSAAVALKHYARVPDDLFNHAAGRRDAGYDARATQNTTQTRADAKRPERTGPAKELENQAFRPFPSAPVLPGVGGSVTLRGFDGATGFPTILGPSASSAPERGAESDATRNFDVPDGVFGPDLTAVIAAWATLPEPIRRAVMALVSSAATLQRTT